MINLLIQVVVAYLCIGAALMLAAIFQQLRVVERVTLGDLALCALFTPVWPWALYIYFRELRRIKLQRAICAREVENQYPHKKIAKEP
jgi:hypothetical protein